MSVIEDCGGNTFETDIEITGKKTVFKRKKRIAKEEQKKKDQADKPQKETGTQRLRRKALLNNIVNLFLEM